MSVRPRDLHLPGTDLCSPSFRFLSSEKIRNFKTASHQSYAAKPPCETSSACFMFPLSSEYYHPARLASFPLLSTTSEDIFVSGKDSSYLSKRRPSCKPQVNIATGKAASSRLAPRLSHDTKLEKRSEHENMFIQGPSIS